jgi:hypothetical protein
MSYYPNQPTYQGNARFSGGGNRRSENDSASPRRTKEENTRSRAPRLTNRVPPPVATPAYLIEQVCMVNKDLSNVPDKISAIADAIQNGRNPQIERLLEDAIVRASSSISKTAKMDPLAPTPDWTHYAERLLTARKEALARDLATATANLQMTRGEANNISITETTMRNDLLNQEIEDSVEENTSSSKSTTSPRKKAADFESPFKQQSAQKFQELNEATSAITALKAEIDAVTEAIALGDFDA